MFHGFHRERFHRISFFVFQNTHHLLVDVSVIDLQHRSFDRILKSFNNLNYVLYK